MKERKEKGKKSFVHSKTKYKNMKFLFKWMQSNKTQKTNKIKKRMLITFSTTNIVAVLTTLLIQANS
jgi:hypothetical protein